MSATAWVTNGVGFAEVVIPRPIGVVFDYVCDLRHMSTWWPAHRTYRRLIGSGGPGTVYAWSMPFSPLPFGLPIVGSTFVTEFERPARFSYRIVSPGLFSRMRYAFAGVQCGTRISLEVVSARERFVEYTAPAFDLLAAVLTRTRS